MKKDTLTPLGRDHTQQTRSRETADRIVAAALALLESQRPEKISVAAIAARAEISVGGFYARFPSKDALFQYLNVDVFESIVSRARALFSPEATADLDASGMIERYIDMAVDGFRTHRLVLQQTALRSRTAKDAAFRERVLALNIELHDLLRSRLMERTQDIKHPNPARAMDLALTAVSGAMREYVLFAEYRPQFAPVEDQQLVAELTDMFRSYLRIEQ